MINLSCFTQILVCGVSTLQLKTKEKLKKKSKRVKKSAALLMMSAFSFFTGERERECVRFFGKERERERVRENEERANALLSCYRSGQCNDMNPKYYIRMK